MPHDPAPPDRSAPARVPRRGPGVLAVVLAAACGTSAPGSGGPGGTGPSTEDASASGVDAAGPEGAGPGGRADAGPPRSADAGAAAGPADAGATGAATNDAAAEARRDAASKATDAGGSAALDGGIADPASFHCVNWADQRDNFVNGLLEPSGLSSAGDSYATVQTKADALLSAFQTTLSADAIRVPINEPTVGGAWWSAYKGLIDSAIAKGMKVIVAYWAWHNGKPDSTTAYDAMWQAVVDAYAANNLVFFDIHNEPFGFKTADWIDFAAAWLAKFPDVPRSRVIVAGSGYDQNVAAVAADPRLNGCLFSLHVYTFFYSQTMTTQGWQNAVTSSVGSNAARTIATEWGAPMSTGVAYDATGAGGNDQAYMAGVPNQLRADGMGSCYWPGLRIGDAWSVTRMNGTGAGITLSVTNASGLGRIHAAWGL